MAPDDDAANLDRKMIAVVVKADQPELFTLVRTIFHAWSEAGSEIDLDAPADVWGHVEKFDLDSSFWQMAKTTFGYTEDNPSLKNFLLRLMLTDYAYHLKGDVPQSLRDLLLPRTGRSNAVVCLAQWRIQHGRIHDVILFYTKTDAWDWNHVFTPYDASYTDAFYKHVEPEPGRAIAWEI